MVVACYLSFLLLKVNYYALLFCLMNGLYIYNLLQVDRYLKAHSEPEP